MDRTYSEPEENELSPVVGTVADDCKSNVAAAGPKTNFALEVLCGVTVSLALVPEAVAFSLAAGLKPAIGLNSAWIIGLFTAILGGRPAMICGATGALAVVVGSLVQSHGVEYLFYAVVLMGIWQILLGLLRVGALLKLIPAPVMIGFCNGLAMVIGLAQFSNFKSRSHAEGTVGGRRLEAFAAFTDGEPFISGMELVYSIMIVISSLLVCLLLPRLTKRVPSALAAIVIGTALEWGVVRAGFGGRTTVVGDIASAGGSFPLPAWADAQYTMPPLNAETFHAVLPLSISMAAIGLLESLMTLNLIDEITREKSNTVRECIGQGVANIVCGVFGGMGGCAMIGQSMINIGSGARHRLSSICAALFLLAIVLFAYPAINVVPVSALVGVMFVVVIKTFEWSSLQLMFVAAMPLTIRRCFSTEMGNSKIRRVDALVILIVTIVTLLTNLAIAVTCGVILSCFMFAQDTAGLIGATTREDVDPETGARVKLYDVHGVLFFGSASHFLELFDVENDPDDVRIVFESGDISDYTAIDTLNKLGERYGGFGKKVTLQQLRPGSSRIVEKASGLLVKELALSSEPGQQLPSHRHHLNIEGTSCQGA